MDVLSNCVIQDEEKPGLKTNEQKEEEEEVRKTSRKMGSHQCLRIINTSDMKV